MWLRCCTGPRYLHNTGLDISKDICQLFRIKGHTFFFTKFINKMLLQVNQNVFKSTNKVKRFMKILNYSIALQVNKGRIYLYGLCRHLAAKNKLNAHNDPFQRSHSTVKIRLKKTPQSNEIQTADIVNRFKKNKK